MIKRITDKLIRQKEFITELFKKKGSVRQSDLTKGMIRVIILCWLVPYLALSVILFYSLQTRTNRQINDTITTSIENAAELCSINIESAIAESKEASYDETIRRSYMNYLVTNDETRMYSEIAEYLNRKYKYNNMFSNTILLFRDEMSEEYYTVSNRAGATYESIQYFKEHAADEVNQLSWRLGTDTRFIYVADRLYLVRNMVTSNYTVFATLVMEINIDNMFGSLENVVWMQDSLIYLDNELVKGVKSTDEIMSEKLQMYANEYILNDKNLIKNQMMSAYDKKEMLAHLTMKVNNQNIAYVVKLDKVGILNESNTLIYMYIIIVVLLIPLLYATFYYIYTNVSKPIAELMSASAKIEDGKYGYKMKEFKRNQEFGKLVDTFNHMSESLEESFNRIYAEEVALRDANIHALQSQINPHFLNNTLEIINWKARMSGDRDVSGMVESLGIMMEATMNRRNEPFITIREELKYVDAYLYIIVRRFGEKFRFEKEIEEGLLDIKIPRLIVQPIVENMVDHGGDDYGNRIGKLRIYGDGRYLHIVVENNGNISKKDAEKIETLLNAERLEDNMHNIGIRNVNLRLKMLYGETSGLTIENPEDNRIVSEIKIERRKLLEIDTQ